MKSPVPKGIQETLSYVPGTWYIGDKPGNVFGVLHCPGPPNVHCRD